MARYYIARTPFFFQDTGYQRGDVIRGDSADAIEADVYALGHVNRQEDPIASDDAPVASAAPAAVVAPSPAPVVPASPKTDPS